MPAELLQRWERPGGRRQIDDTNYESDEDPAILNTTPNSAANTISSSSSGEARATPLGGNEEPPARPANIWNWRTWVDDLLNSDDEWEEEI